jgi:hypothetical protein
MNITALLWSVLKNRVRNRFPPPTSLKQCKDVFQEKWYKIMLEATVNLYDSIPRWTAALRQEGGPKLYK